MRFTATLRISAAIVSRKEICNFNWGLSGNCSKNSL